MRGYAPPENVWKSMAGNARIFQSEKNLILLEPRSPRSRSAPAWRLHNAQKWSFSNSNKALNWKSWACKYSFKNVFYSLNLVLDPGHDAASQSTCPFQMLVRRELIWKSSVLSTCFHNSKILKLLKLLMSIAFGQNGLDFALKIE